MAFLQPTDAALFGLLGLLAALALGLLYWRLALRARIFDLDPAWLDSFSPDRYQVMQRLLDREDLDYLRSLPGYERKQIDELRARRARIFRTYLEELASDFERLQASGRLMLAAGSAPAGLTEELFSAQVRFTRAMWRVRLQAFLFRFGVGSVRTEELLGAFARYSELTRQLAAPPATA
jgi:hypothetical protein